MKRYLKLYLVFVKQSIMSAAMYQTDFIVWSIITIGWFGFNVVFYKLLYSNVTLINGWGFYHMLLFQGVYFIIEFFLWGVLWQNMNILPSKINSGQLDLELTKPVNPRFLLAFRIFRWNSFNSLLLGIGSIIYSVKMGGIYISFMGVILAIVAIAFSFMFIYSWWFSTMCLAFFVGRLENIQHVFPALRQFWKVPLPFYQGIVKTILTYAFPLALVTTVPAELMKGNKPYTLLLVLVIVAVISLRISRWVFESSIKKYSGASA